MPRIGAIVCTYNGAAYVSATVESIIGQTFRDWRLVVVDDGSTDRTVEILRDHARRDDRISVVVQANRGEAAARNRGMAELGGCVEYVIFIDHDDVWEPDALDVLVRALDADPHALGVHGLARYIDGSGAAIRPGEGEAWTLNRRALKGGQVVDWPQRLPTVFETFLLTNPILTHGQVLLRRRAVLDAGPFDHATAPSSDWDHWLRITARGYFHPVERVVIGYRQHEANMSRARREMEQARRRIFEKLAVSESLTPEQRAAVRRGYHLGLKESSELWLTWAERSIQDRKWLRALNQLRHAGLERAEYLAGDLRAGRATAGLPPRKVPPLLPWLGGIAAGMTDVLVDLGPAVATLA
jgi:glycosyltransferase involved in cell wall biosynthesis